MTEAQLHKAVAQFLRVALKPPTIWTTIGHGGGGRIRGAQLKAMGVQKGWPDILIIHADVNSGWWPVVVGLELKAAKGTLSAEQKAFGKSLETAGGVYHVVRSVEEVWAALQTADIPLYAR